MKHKLSIGALLAALLIGAVTTVIAQNGPGPKCKGYGGPPATQEERVARQQACPNGGSCTNVCPGQGACGKGQGQGKCQGPRDGTGPRHGK